MVQDRRVYFTIEGKGYVMGIGLVDWSLFSNCESWVRGYEVGAEWREWQ